MRWSAAALAAVALAAVPVSGGGGDYTLLNSVLGQLRFTADTSGVAEVTADAKVFELYVRLPEEVPCYSFGVGQLDVGGEMKPQDDAGPEMERYDLSLTASRVIFKFDVPLCIKTSLPGNDYDCSGMLNIESKPTRKRDTRVHAAYSLYSPDFDQFLPARAEPVGLRCEERFQLDGVEFEGDHLKRIAGVDVTGIIVSALNGPEKESALKPIREAVCKELDKASGSLSALFVRNSLTELLNVSASSDSVSALEARVSAQSSQASVELFDIANNVVTDLVLPSKTDSATGLKTVQVPLKDNFVVDQLLAGTNVTRVSVAEILPVAFEAITGSALPTASSSGGANSLTFDVLAALEVLMGSAALSEARQVRFDIQGLGKLYLQADGLTISMEDVSNAAYESLDFGLIGAHTVGLPALRLGHLHVAGSFTARVEISTRYLLDQQIDFNLEQQFRADAQVGSFVSRVAMLLALDRHKVFDVQVGSIASHVLECALAAFFVPMQVADFSMSAGSLGFGLSGFTDAIGTTVQDLVNSLLPVYQSKVISALGLVVGRQIMGKALAGEGGSAVCPKASRDDANASELYDFGVGIVAKLSGMVRKDLVNTFVEENLQNGLPLLSSNTKLLSASIPRIGGIEPQQLAFSLDHLAVSLAHVDDLALLQAQNRTHLHNRLLASKLRISVGAQLASYPPQGSSSPSDVSRDALLAPGQSNLFNVDLDVPSLELALDVVARLTEYNVMSLSLGEMFNLDCWIGRLEPGGGRHNATLSLNQFDFSFTCETCDSLLVRQVADRLGASGARSDLIEFASRLKNRWLELVHGRFEPDSWDVTIQGARARCSGDSGQGFLSNSLPPPPNVGGIKADHTDAHYLLAGLGALLIFFGILSCAPEAVRNSNFTLMHKRKKRGALLDNVQNLERIDSTSSFVPQSPGIQSSLLANQNGNFAIGGQSDEGGGRSAALARAMAQPLWQNESIPYALRAAMPVMLLVNVSFFIYGHIGYVIRISIIGSLLGGKVELANLTQFSVVTSTQELWHGGAIALALLISVFSIMWPYVKLVLLSLCWFVPVQRLGFHTRGKLLNALDVVGKWSMIELFVVAFVLVFLNIPIDSPDATVSFLPPELFAFHIAVLPQSNLYTFIVALLMSIFLSSTAATYHELLADREVVEKAGALALATAPQVQLSIPHVVFFGRDLDNEELGSSTALAKRSRRVHAALLGGLGVSALIMVVAFSLNVLQVEILGLVGQAMKLGGSVSKSEYSLLSFIAHSMAPGTPFGQGCLAFVILLVCVVSPLLQLGLAAAAVLPGRRYSLQQALHMRLAHQITSAFVALPVFLLGVGVSVLELGMLTRTLLADECRGAQDIIVGVLYPMGLISKRDAQAGCFALDAKLEPTLFWFLAAVFASNLIIFIIFTYMLEEFIMIRSTKEKSQGERREMADMEQGQELQQGLVDQFLSDDPLFPVDNDHQAAEWLVLSGDSNANTEDQYVPLAERSIEMTRT